MMMSINKTLKSNHKNISYRNKQNHHHHPTTTKVSAYRYKHSTIIAKESTLYTQNVNNTQPNRQDHTETPPTPEQVGSP